MKVFDCQEFPKEIRAELFFRYEHENDVYIELDIVDIDDNLVTKWLSENGAKKDETVIIKYWW